MVNQSFKQKRRQWLRRYIPAEGLGTVCALTAAWITYVQTGSYIDATAAGWLGEGIGFYGYFILYELLAGGQHYKGYKIWKRLTLAVTMASTNLLVEFLPAEILDNFLIRPFLMFWLPHYIHPYPLGFLAGKFCADLIFYAFAITGYESKKRWLPYATAKR